MGKIRDGLIKAGCIGLIVGGAAILGGGIKNGVECSNLNKELEKVQQQKNSAMQEFLATDINRSYYNEIFISAHEKYQSGVISKSDFDKMTDKENVVKTYLTQNDQENELVDLFEKETDLKTELSDKQRSSLGGMLGGGILMAVGKGILGGVAIGEDRKTDELDKLEVTEECPTE